MEEKINIKLLKFEFYPRLIEIDSNEINMDGMCLDDSEGKNAAIFINNFELD